MAARFFVNGGVDNNWGTIGNWSLTSGGAGGQAVPTTSDDVTFDTNSPNCSVNASNRVCKTLTITSGYNKTLTFSFKITVSGNITLDPAVTFAGSAALEIIATGTITTNAKTLNIPFTFLGNSQTFTLADDLNISALLTLGNGAGNATINSNNIKASGSVTKAAISNISGTTKLVFNGTGTWTHTSGTGNLQLPVDINTAGTITLSSSAVIQYAGTFTYVAGTVVTTSSIFSLVGASTITSGSIIWDTFRWNSPAATVTFNDDVNTATLDLTTAGAGATVTFNGANINVTSTLTTAKVTLQGTTTINLIGTSVTLAFSTLFAQLSRFDNPFVINTPSGTVTVTGVFSVSAFTYTAGNVTGSVNIGSGAGGGGSRCYGWTS